MQPHVALRCTYRWNALHSDTLHTLCSMWSCRTMDVALRLLPLLRLLCTTQHMGTSCLGTYACQSATHHSSAYYMQIHKTAMCISCRLAAILGCFRWADVSQQIFNGWLSLMSQDPTSYCVTKICSGRKKLLCTKTWWVHFLQPAESAPIAFLRGQCQPVSAFCTAKHYCYSNPL